MKRSRFREEQIIEVLIEREVGQKTAGVSRRQGISEGISFKWKLKFGSMEVSDGKRLKALDTENVSLKELLAETMLDKRTHAGSGGVRRQAKHFGSST